MVMNQEPVTTEYIAYYVYYSGARGQENAQFTEFQSFYIKINLQVNYSAKTSITRVRSMGSKSRSNHGLRLSHKLLRGLGCGSGSTVGP